MTRAEKFKEMYNDFHKEVKKTFPEFTNAGFFDSIRHEGIVSGCCGIECPVSGDCSRCDANNYWSQEYQYVPYMDNPVRITSDNVEIVLNGDVNFKIQVPDEDRRFRNIILDCKTGEIRGIEEVEE